MSNRTIAGATSDHPPFRQRVTFVIHVLLAVVVLALLLWFQIKVLLLGFTGLLLATFLYVISAWGSRHLHLPYWLSLLFTCLLILVVLGGTIWLIEWRISAQVDALRSELPAAWNRVKQSTDVNGWKAWIIGNLQDQFEALPSETLLGRGVGFLSRMGTILTETFVVIFVGLFLAINPQIYVRGTVRLIPLRHRDTARQLMIDSGWLMWWWLIGQLAAMLFIGIVTGLAVWLLGVPLALTLGVIAALLNFIPNFGPIVAAVPAALLAAMQSPVTAVWVLLAYLAIQMLQNHVVTPLVQQQAVRLPPVILILSQLFMYYWAGLLGMALAPPLAAIAILFIERLYVQRTLNDPMHDTTGFWPDGALEIHRPAPTPSDSRHPS